MKGRVLVDSSVWIELFTLGKRQSLCRKALDGADEIVVPTLVLFEVYKKVSSQASEEDGLAVVAEMSRHRVVDLDRTVALLAADISRDQGLGMADSIMLAHSRAVGATLVSLDNDFAAFAGAKVLR